MARPAKLCAWLTRALVAGALAGCGTQGISVKPQFERGAVLFSQRCGGCHTLRAAGTHGSASNIRTRERNDGPNFNARLESVTRVLYAIRNGGYSGAIMPQNIVVGDDAQAVAAFVAKYSGTSIPKTLTPGKRQPSDSGSSGP